MVHPCDRQDPALTHNDQPVQLGYSPLLARRRLPLARLRAGAQAFLNAASRTDPPNSTSAPASGLHGTHSAVIERLRFLDLLETALTRFEDERRLLDAALQDRIPHSLCGRVGEIAADIADGVRHQVLPAVVDLLAEQD